MKFDTFALREVFGLTQKQLADKFGVSLRTVQGWDAKQTMPEYVYYAFYHILKMEFAYDVPEYDFSKEVSKF